MAAQQDRAFDDLRNTVQEYVRMLRRRRHVALLGVTVISSAAFWFSQYLPREYAARTIFERRDDLALRNLIRQNSPYSFDQLRSSLTLDMTGSRALADAAVAIGLLPAGSIESKQALSKEELRVLDDCLRRHRLDASVRMVHSSPALDTIELRCSANDPATARRYVTALRDGYIRRTRERIADILSQTRDFFAGEAQRFQQQVGLANQTLQEQFAEFPGVDPADPTSAGVQLERLRSERLRLAERKAELDAQVAARERFLTSTLLNEPAAVAAPTSRPAPPPQLARTNSAVEQAIKQVEQELVDAIVMHRMTNAHPKVIALRRKLDNLYAARATAQSPAALAAVPNAARPDASDRLRAADPVLAAQRLRVELELDALRAQLGITERNLNQAETRVAKLTSLYDRLIQRSGDVQQLQNRLEQDVTTAKIWRGHLAELERILAAENERRGTRFVLVEEPKDNPRAVKPRAAAILVVCLGCGLAGAALLVALAELLDRSFHSAGQVTRALGLPILECIGVIATPAVRRRRLITRLTWTPAACVLLLCTFASATLAYTSLEYPEFHRRTVGRLDHVLKSVGAPPTFLAREPER